jgi:HD-like signal output (HDOD) protein
MDYTLAEVLERLETDLPALSPTAAKIQELGARLDASPTDLARLVKLDPVLAARVMKLCNSSYCAPTKKIVNLERAVLLLGPNTVKNLALSLLILGTTREAAWDAPFEMESFWLHSLAVGTAARLLAEAREAPRQELEEYFVAGLIHDLGLLVEARFYPEELAEAVAQAPSMGLPAAEAYTLCGLDHTRVGQALAEYWDLAERLGAAMRHHHDPLSDDPANRRVATVSAANRLVKEEEIGLVLDPGRARLAAADWTCLGLEPAAGRTVAKRLPEELEKARVFLHV